MLRHLWIWILNIKMMPTIFWCGFAISIAAVRCANRLNIVRTRTAPQVRVRFIHSYAPNIDVRVQVRKFSEPRVRSAPQARTSEPPNIGIRICALCRASWSHQFFWFESALAKCCTESRVFSLAWFCSSTSFHTTMSRISVDKSLVLPASMPANGESVSMCRPCQYVLT